MFIQIHLLSLVVFAGWDNLPVVAALWRVRKRETFEREKETKHFREREIVTAIEMGSHSHQQNHYCYYYHFNHCVWSISATKSFSSSSSSGITLTLTSFLSPLCPFPHCHQSALNPDETFLHLCRSSTFPWL